LAKVANAVAAEKNYSIRAVTKSEDELGRLIDGFNEMLDQIQTRDSALREARDNLEKSVDERTRDLQVEIQERKETEAKLESTHKQLVDASRQAGMAEVATGVLHNVGNVLNSVNVSATLVAEHLKKSKADNLIKIAAMLHEHISDLGAFITSDPKGKLLPNYLSQLAGHLAEEQQSTLAELDLLQKNINHIKDIVAMQQSFGRVSGVAETVKITDLIEDALRIYAGALTRHQVQVVREYEELQPISVDKHRVLQILVNLIGNAKFACADSARKDRQLTLKVSNGDDRVRIAVIDNGVGIPQDNLTRIFNHGFTTRKGGHGFGLHSGALAAKEMGGALTVHSEGPGKGSAFILELPLHLSSDPSEKNP
jgi:C4-dicarboxylate-specific signal transduction histidine kinase